MFFKQNYRHDCHTRGAVFFVASHADVLRGSSRVGSDEPLRMSAWEAIFFGLPSYWVSSLLESLRNRTAKRVSVTNVTGLLLACFVGNSLNIDTFWA